jgi:hypothetical protein
MDDDWGWSEDTSTTVLTYILSKDEMNWESFLSFLYLSSLNACFQIFFFCFLLSFYFLSRGALSFCIFIFPSYLVPVPILYLLSASLPSQCFFPWFLFFFFCLSFYLFWRLCEPQCVNLFSWQNQDVTFVKSWPSHISEQYNYSLPTRFPAWTAFAKNVQQQT